MFVRGDQAPQDVEYAPDHQRGQEQDRERAQGDRNHVAALRKTQAWPCAGQPVGGRADATFSMSITEPPGGLMAPRRGLSKHKDLIGIWARRAYERHR